MTGETDASLLADLESQPTVTRVRACSTSTRLTCTPHARAAGQLCAATATSEVVDASVVLVARVVDGVTVTGDADDLRRLDPSIDLVRC